MISLISLSKENTYPVKVIDSDISTRVSSHNELKFNFLMSTDPRTLPLLTV